MNKVLLTGATGFIGSKLYSCLTRDYDVVTAVRKHKCDRKSNTFEVGEFTGDTDFSNALTDISVVIHLAALAHITSTSDKSYEDYKRCNTDATLALAKQAANYGVKRFVFLSSIGVNGISNETPFTAFDKPKPVEGYAISKLEAEVGLKNIGSKTGMEIVIVRPPLVYGKNAPGNFNTLLNLAKKNIPLPLGAINNSRSFVSLDNLVDLICVCIKDPRAGNQTFLVSDDDDVSTTTLLKLLILAGNNNPRLIPVPVYMLKFLAGLFGKKDRIDRFSNSLTVNIEHTKKTLNWRPSLTFKQGIQRCF